MTLFYLSGLSRVSSAGSAQQGRHEVDGHGQDDGPEQVSQQCVVQDDPPARLGEE